MGIVEEGKEKVGTTYGMRCGCPLLPGLAEVGILLSAEKEFAQVLPIGKGTALEVAEKIFSGRLSSLSG